MPVKIGLTEIEDDVAEKYPGLQEYTVCQSKAFLQGVMGCGVGASAGFASSILYRRKFPHASKHTAVVLSIVCGVTTGYIIASIATQRCQDNWVHYANKIHNPPSVIEVPSKQKKLQDLREALESGKPITTVRRNKYGDSVE